MLSKGGRGEAIGKLSPRLTLGTLASSPRLSDFPFCAPRLSPEIRSSPRFFAWKSPLACRFLANFHLKYRKFTKFPRNFGHFQNVQARPQTISLASSPRFFQKPSLPRLFHEARREASEARASLLDSTIREERKGRKISD